VNLANQITIFRIVLVPVFAVLLVYESTSRAWMQPAAFACFAVACLTDALDGWVARRFRQTTRLGTYIDPIADKLLLLTGFSILGFWSGAPEAMQIPTWVSIAVIARDVIILIGATLIFLLTGSLKAEPIFIGKATTLFQMSTLLAVLGGVPEPLLRGLFVAVGILTVISGLLYIRIGGRLLQATP
jgi:cardiolipin synthase